MTGGMQATIKLMSPEEISARAGGAAPPPLRLPAGATLFAERALRLRQLAGGHAMRDFLIFVADLAQAQQQVLARTGELPLPTASDIAAALPVPVSTIEVPGHRIGRIAVEMVMARLSGDDLAETRLVAPTFTDRGSVVHAPAAAQPTSV